MDGESKEAKESENSINPKRLQQFLSFVSEEIQKGDLPTDFGDKVVLLDVNHSVEIGEELSREVYFREKSLTTNVPVTSPQMAQEIYSGGLKFKLPDGSNFEQALATSYTLTHDVIFFESNKEGDSDPRFFNIEEINRISTIKTEEAAEGFEKQQNELIGRIFPFKHSETGNKGSLQKEPSIRFVSLDIDNVSKDTFTSTSNYSITLKLAFNTFEDLLRKSIILRSIKTKKEVDRVPLIYFLYKFYDSKNKTIANLQNLDGVIISQKLKLNNSKFPITNKLMGAECFTKNFHLVFHKHSIEPNALTKDQTFNTKLSNILTINFLAYEGDTSAKPKFNSKVPTCSENLYKLITKERLQAAKIPEVSQEILLNFEDKIKETSEKIKKTQFSIRCAEKYNRRLNEIKKKLTTGTDDEKQKKAEAELKDTPLAKFKKNQNDLKALRKDLKNNKNDLKEFKALFPKALVKIIVNNLQTYSINPPYSYLNTYDANLTLTDIIGSFDFGELASATSAGAMIGSVATPIGTAGGALAGAAADITLQFAKIATKVNLLENNLDLPAIKSDLTLENLELTKESNFYDSYNVTAEEISKQITAVNLLKKELPSFSFKGLFGNNQTSAQALTEAIAVGASFYSSELAKASGGDGSLSASESFRLINFTNLKLFFAAGLTAANGTKKDVVAEFVTQKLVDSIQSDLKEQQDNALNNSADTSLLDEDDAKDSSSKAKIYFFLFGDLIKLVSEISNNSNFLVGGRMVPKVVKDSSGTLKFYYLNFAYYPISLDLFNEYLNKTFLKTQKDFRYSAEQFLRDVFENIIKPAASSVDSKINSYTKLFSPASLFMNSSLHKNSKGFKDYFEAANKSIDLLDDRYFSFKEEFIKSQNLLIESGNEIKKVYSFYSSDNFLNYDFFNKWNKAQNAAVAANEVGFPDAFFGDGFRAFITSLTLVPSYKIVDTKEVSDSILDRNFKFTRIDNANLYTGQMLNNQTIFRQPYKASANMHAYMSHFLTNGSMFFIQPPPFSEYASYDSRVLGYHGFYAVLSAKLSIDFLTSETNLNKKFMIEGVLVYDGEGNKKEGRQFEKEAQNNCIDYASQEPARE